MAENTLIEWASHTFNPWRGCRKVHTGCEHCYAEVNRSVKMHGIQWGTEKQGGTRVRLADSGWKQPAKWNRDAEAAGERRRVFCASLADVFERWSGVVWSHNVRPLYRRADGTVCDFVPSVPHSPLSLGHLRADLFRVIRETPWLDWLLLTKHGLWDGADHPERGLLHAWPQTEPGVLERFDNVWLLGSASDQETLNRIAPELLKVKQAGIVRYVGVSAEPMTGPMDFLNVEIGQRRGAAHYADVLRGVELSAPPVHSTRAPSLDWVIFGGESDQPGHPPARPCALRWILDGVSQCRAAGVPPFVKQLGSHVIADVEPTAAAVAVAERMGGRASALGRMRLRDKKGGDWSEWAAELRVREFPRAA